MVDFMEPTKPHGNSDLVPCLPGSLTYKSLPEKLGNLRVFGALGKRGVYPNLQVLMISPRRGFASGLNRLLRVHSEILYEKFWRSKLRVYMVNHHSCCIYVNNQAEFMKTRLNLQTN